MGLSNLYHLNDEEIALLYKDLSENFFDDDLYITIFPSNASRKKALPFLFKHYLKAIQSNCYIVADSEDKNSIMVVYDSSKESFFPYAMKLVWFNIKMAFMMLRIHSFTSITHMIECVDMFTSRWVKGFVSGESFHIDLLFTRESARQKGLAGTLIREVMDEAKIVEYDITIETHHKSNLSLYEGLGFKLMSTISHEEYDLEQYCLLLRKE